MENIIEKNPHRISFNYKNGRVRVYKRVIEALGNPPYIQFLIQPEEKQFFICGLDHREIDSFPVVQYVDSRNQGVVLNGQRFIRRVSEIAGWDLEKTHVVCGEHIADMKMFRFDLMHAMCVGETHCGSQL